MRLIIIILLCSISSYLYAGESRPQSVVKVEETTGQLADQSPDSVTDKNQANAKRAIVFRSLAQLDELIQAGVPSLALSLLETEQKKRPRFTADWYAFEYKRAIIYQARSDWSALDQRISWLFDTAVPGKQITLKIRLWFETRQVIARLRGGEPALALHQLRKLIWLHDVKKIDASLLSVWRRLVIRAYVLLEQNEDAQKALVKYNQDYDEAKQDIDWQLLQAEILLQTSRPRQAVNLLKSIAEEQRTDPVQALLYIAEIQNYQLLTNSSKARKKISSIAKQMRHRLDGKLLSRAQRWLYTYVAYRAALALNDVTAQIHNLEAILSLGIEQPILGQRYTVSADDLWALYEVQGLQISNDNNLLVGDDAAWLALIKKLKKKSASKALYVNVALALNSRSVSNRQLANANIVDNLKQRRDGLALINQLYLHSERIDDFAVLPEIIRYSLVDFALNEGDISEAAQLMKTLDEPPQGHDVFAWRMRKARVLVLQGEYSESAALLKQSIEPVHELEDKMLDRYIQVLFDFQTVQQHQLALELFDLIRPAWQSEQVKREIYFWKAESWYALAYYDRSALFYLKSATALAGQESDLWAQSARFKAAGALVKAGIYEDANKVYQDLLKVTVSDSRKSLIRQNLQKIRLLKHARLQKQD